MITASIVTYCTPQEELETILSCAKNSPIDKIYIIDNSPTSILRNNIYTFSNNIEYIWGHGNIGYGSAHNIAMRKAYQSGATYHIILNPDISFQNGVIEACRDYMEQNASVGTIMPKVIYPNGETQYLCKLLPTPFNLIFRRFFPFKFLKKYNDKYELRLFGYDKTINVPCLSGCFMFLRTKIFEDIGYFDERYFMYGEDFDYYRRIHTKYKTIFYPLVFIIHKHKKESYKNKKLLIIHIKSMICYFNKWGWFYDKERKFVNEKILNELKK
ncbi:glycosyltransferase family 2 protein [Parabacteroides faecis]|nr:glycosyltransferase family 2 protein [Parabacteroides faecis]MBC8618443.1 glycosyltransferase family 2 protein [Parabacteroides faecis]